MAINCYYINNNSFSHVYSISKCVYTLLGNIRFYLLVCNIANITIFLIVTPRFSLKLSVVYVDYQ